MPAHRKASDEKPDLEDACNTDEIYDLAYRLAAWGLRHGECDEYNAVDWVLDHPREAKLPRGSHARLNPTKHHVKRGASRAVEQFVPGLRMAPFNPEPLHELAARIEGSGVTHEKYLLGVIALCFKYETLTPVVTGPLLAQVVGVAKQNASEVLRKWSTTLAYGFFTRVTYDGIQGHGRIWAVDPTWQPTSKPTHRPGCSRSRSRCKCPGVLSQNGLPIFSAEKDRSPKVRQFETWVTSLKPGAGVTVTDASRALGVTRHAATKLLEAAEGTLLKNGTFGGGRVFRPGRGHVRQGKTWFTKDGRA